MKKQTQLTLSATHPAFEGHFPGTPIVPGVVLLDEVLHAIFMHTGLVETAWQISTVKFLSPLKPNESVIITHEQTSNGSVKFEVSAETRQIVTGSLTALPMSAGT